MTKFIFEYIEHISNLAGIGALLVSIFIWVKLKRQSKLIRESSKRVATFESFEENRKFHEKINSLKPVALCLSLIPASKSIKNDVKTFLDSKGGSYKNMEIIEHNEDGLSPQKLESFLNSLRQKRAEIEAMNASEVHLFIQGPIQAATLVGAILDNWKPVKLYHKNANLGTYEYWCHLIK